MGPFFLVLWAGTLLLLPAIKQRWQSKGIRRNINPFTKNKMQVTDLLTFENLVAQLKLLPDSSTRLQDIQVIGNIPNVTDDHPVIQAVLERWKRDSKPGKRYVDDKMKIALAIEGGGMRGCVSAGASAALNVLGINDAIDVVYGSSAGAMVGAYFISRQFSGVAIYHDILPLSGKSFIDKVKLLFAVGVPTWVNIFFRRKRRDMETSVSFIDDGTGPPHTPLTDVISLDFLLLHVMGLLQPLDWSSFSKNEESQPLKVVASSLCSFRSVAMNTPSQSHRLKHILSNTPSFCPLKTSLFFLLSLS